MTSRAKGGWWTTVAFGGALVTAYRTDWPRGPWKSREAAEAAMQRWRERTGSEARTILDAHNVQVVGPFRTRKVAREVDVSDWSDHVDRDAGVYWTTWGEARGTCGHRHRSPETARRCVEQDRRDVATGHPASGLDRPYSDRAVYRMPGDGEPAEAGRVGEPERDR